MDIIPRWVICEVNRNPRDIQQSVKVVRILSALNNCALARERERQTERDASRFRGLACNFHGVVINSLRSCRTCWQLYSNGNIRMPIERCATLVNMPRMVRYAEKRLPLWRSRFLVRVLRTAVVRIDAIICPSRRIRMNIQIPIGVRKK